MGAELKLIIAMLIFGSIGVFVRALPFSSEAIALARGITGSLFLLAFALIIKGGLSLKSIGKNIRPLVLSGAALGLNWVFLFQAYRYTSVANAVICYYTAPILVVLAAGPILKERVTKKSLICVFAAACGMLLVAGSSGLGIRELRGVFYGLLAAVFYAAVMLLNRFFKDIDDLERAFGQLLISALTLLPYAALRGGLDFSGAALNTLALLGIVGVVHTGAAYLMYFSALKQVKSQTAAAASYIDPLFAIFLSVTFLKEPVTHFQLLGGVLVLGATSISSFDFKRCGRAKRKSSS